MPARSRGARGSISRGSVTRGRTTRGSVSRSRGGVARQSDTARMLISARMAMRKNRKAAQAKRSKSNRSY